MTMTNVDFNGFNDWSKEELLMAKETIENILHERQRVWILEALKNLESAFVKLQNCTEDIAVIEIGEELCTLSDIYESIKLSYAEIIKEV